MLFRVPTFEEAEMETHRGIQEEFGETFILRPQRSRPNYSTSPDPTRLEMVITAIFSWPSRNVNLVMNETVVTSRDPELHVRRCDLAYDLIKGDQIVRCKTGEVFEIIKREPDTYSGICYQLLQMGVQS